MVGYQPVDVAVESLGLGLVFGAGIAFILTVVLGGLALGVAPAFTYQTMETVSAEPIRSCLSGLILLLGLLTLAVGLATTVLDIFLVVPLIMLAVALWGVGAAMAFPVLGVRLVGHEGGLFVPLLVGGGINAGLTLTGIGVVLAVLIGASGLGSIIRGAMRHRV